MADDLVAELTLRIRNEMESGFEEMKSEFSGLKDSISGLNGTLTETNELLANLRTPLAFEEGLSGAATSAESVVTAIEGIAPASVEAVDAVQKIGAAIDEDAAKMQAMLTEMHATQDEMGAGGNFNVGSASEAGGGSGGFVPVPDENGTTPPNEKPSGSDREGAASDASHGAHLGMFGELLGILSLKSAIDSWADFDTMARQITVTEGLTPSQSDIEVPRLKHFANNMATRWASSSKEILEAYEYLITDSLSRHTVETMLPNLAEASTAYNVPLTSIDQAAYTLYKNLSIPADQMGDALAVLHHAAMIGHFTMADFSSQLPGLGGQMSLIGMKGLTGDVTAASALEIIRRNTGTGGEAATELDEFFKYMHSMMALRMFDRTTRMEDMLGPSGKKLLEKYHIEPLDLPEYLNDARVKGADPINAMTDYFAKILSGVSSPTDRADIVGAYLHNHQAQDAMLALVQYKQDFEHYQTTLSNVSDKTLGADWYTATAGKSADSRVLNENLSYLWRSAGLSADYVSEGLSGLVDSPYTIGSFLGVNNGYGPDGTWSGRPAGGQGNNPLDSAMGASPIQITPQIPITVNVHVDKDGNVKVDGGVTGGVTNAPGTSVRVDQGNVLSGVH